MAAVSEAISPQVRILGVVSAGHFMSHYFSMTLPPILIFLNQDLGISFTVLGFLLSAKSLASGLAQMPAGILVDRLGAKTVLSAGLFVTSLSIAVFALATDYWMLILGVILFGIGNSVFHPADYSILNGSMDSRYIGRSFSMHTFAGFLGNAVAPAVVLGITALWNWRVALLASSVCGIVVLVALASQWRSLRFDAALTEGPKGKKRKGAAKPASDEPPQPAWRSLVEVLASPALLFLFLFFTVSNLASGGLKNFAVSGMMALHDTPESAAGGALTGFLFASAFGVLVGGYIADRTSRHDLVAALSLLTAALVMLLVSSVNLHVVLLVFVFAVAGMAHGIIRPARDMMIRTASPQGASGRTFGFVHSGESIGGAVAPVAYGLLLDIGQPQWIFFSSALFLILCMATLLLSGRAARASARAEG